MLALVQLMESRYVEISTMGEGYVVLKLKESSLNASLALKLRQEPDLLLQLKDVARLVVDLGNVSVGNSSGLAVLVELFQSMLPGSRLYIVRANAELSQLLKDTFLDQLFPVYDRLDDIPEECAGFEVES